MHLKINTDNIALYTDEATSALCVRLSDAEDNGLSIDENGHIYINTTDSLRDNPAPEPEEEPDTNALTVGEEDPEPDPEPEPEPVAEVNSPGNGIIIVRRVIRCNDTVSRHNNATPGPMVMIPTKFSNNQISIDDEQTNSIMYHILHP